MKNKCIIGVLALQGAVEPHKPHIEACGAQFRAVKTPEAFDAVDGFILPGGESTTMLKLIDIFGLWDSLARNFERKPVWGICAGAILMAETVYRDVDIPLTPSLSPEGRGGKEREIQKSFGLLPLTIQRNGYGRQLDSHTAQVNGYTVSFIRAPVITALGAGVETLATHEGASVWVKSRQYMATTFHPELTPAFPSPMHRMFVDLVRKNP